MSEFPIFGAPTDEQMRAYLDGEHGPPSPEAVAIIQAELERSIRNAECCCEGSPPECPLHGDAE